MQIIAPILLIISLVLHFTKAMMNPEDKKIKAKIKNCLIAAVILFILPVIINLTMLLVNDNFSLANCWNNLENVALEHSNYIEQNEDQKKDFLTNPDDYDEGSAGDTEDSSNETIGGTATVEAFLNSLSTMSHKVIQDKNNGNKWTYSNSNTRNTFSQADSSTKSTNCALYIVWGLIDVGVLDSGDRFYKAYRNSNNFISYRNDAKEKMQEKMYYIDGENKTASSLISSGDLQAGDVVLWYNQQHTNVYAGNGKWYDAGRQSGSNGSGPNDNFKFTTLGPVEISSLMNARVWQILRIK